MEWSVAVKFDRSSVPMTCARSLALASSSRSQVGVQAASAAACLTCERPSVSVRWRPPLAVAIVTHLVTRPQMTPSDQPWLSGNLAAHRALREVIGTALGTPLELPGHLERRRARLHRPCQVKSICARVHRPESPPRRRSRHWPGVTAFGTCSVICLDLPREAHGVIVDAGLCLVKERRTPGLLDANYRRAPARCSTMQPGGCADVCSDPIPRIARWADPCLCR